MLRGSTNRAGGVLVCLAALWAGGVFIGCQQRVVGVRNTWANNPTSAGQTRYVRQSYAPEPSWFSRVGKLLFGWTEALTSKEPQTITVPAGTTLPSAGSARGADDRPAERDVQ